MEYTIRQAVPGDADALVRMHTAVHEECYGRVLPAAFFAARRASLQERTERRRPYLDSTEPRIIALDAGGDIVGFADAGQGRDEDRPQDLELYSIYTLIRTYGSGLGSALLNAALGDSPAYLWVLESNPRARAFYAKHGFQPDGERKLLPDEWYALPRFASPGPRLPALGPADSHAETGSKGPEKDQFRTQCQKICPKSKEPAYFPRTARVNRP